MIDNPIETGRPHIISTRVLLTRDDFRNSVFQRDDHKCVICGEPAADAHHIIERRLFSDGGYYLDNGASLCPEHHIEAEKTILSASEIREAAGITDVILPDHLYRDYEYDKWGNIILTNGKRIKGELMQDESVLKIMANVMDEFSPYAKYPRTYHVPWTGSTTTDDKILESMSPFEGHRVVVTEKRDGENATIYHDGYYHARSIDGNSHPSQSWLKSSMQNWFFEIPEGWRVCGENLYATHSLKYDDLHTYFEVFSIWNEKNECLSWDDTAEWCKLLGLRMVPVLFDGLYDEEAIRSIPLDETSQEGYVIRLADCFHYSRFRHSVAKYVRNDHIQETVHNWRMNWDKRKINELIKD